MSPEVEEAVHAEREESFLLAVPEKRFLRWLAGKMPRWILPDDMTALGVLAAFGVAAAYQLSNDSLAWLWMASGLLVLQPDGLRRRWSGNCRRDACAAGRTLSH